MQSRSGGEILVASLLAQDATHLFGVPGASFLPALDLKSRSRRHARWAWPVAAVLLALAVVAVFWWWTARP